MKLSGRIKPISYLKAHAPDVIRGLSEGDDPVIVTLNGEARAVLQDIDSYEQTQETLALLKILALGKRDVEEGRVRPAAEVFARIRTSVVKQKGAPDAMGGQTTLTDADWLVEKELQRDQAEAKRAAANNPRDERHWRAVRDNFKRQITMGRDGLREAASRANRTRGGN